MPELAKAALVPIDAQADPQPAGPEIPVQFNPSTLHLVIASVTDRGQTTARQAEQQVGTGNVTLTVDLHFDTADEGTTEKPKSVRVKTKKVAHFMLPARGSSGPPPRVRFQWGDFLINGIMGSYSEDIDLFSPQGIPLRAKVSISIRGQDGDFAAKRKGPGAAKGTGATTPGATKPGAPGTVGPGGGPGFGASLSLGVGLGVSLGGSLAIGDRTGVAIGGESAAEFTARMGADPAAWRGVAAGVESTLALPAGAEIDFSSGLSASAGVGASTGVEAAAAPTPEAAVGLGGATTPMAAGFALSAAGGVQSAVESVQIAHSSAAATDAKQAFALAPAAAAAAPTVVPAPPQTEQPRPALRAAPLPVAAAQRDAPPAPPPPRADPRSTSFGYGVPLRPRVTGAAAARAGGVGGGDVVIGPRVRVATDAPTTVDPTAAPWLALAAADVGRAAADDAQGRRRPCACGGAGRRGECECGCGGGCR